MGHVYQPLLLRVLLDVGGTATLRQLAQEFARNDESELLRYEKTIKDMPVRVLKSHGVVERDGPVVKLKVSKLTLEQKARLRLACETKLQGYVEQRGLAIWDYRLREDDQVPEGLRYRVLKAANGRCALCGVRQGEERLEVDHIIPRSKGGSNDFENLQALCGPCNRSKSNRDDADLRQPAPERISGCVFCDSTLEGGAVIRNGGVFAIKDAHPVSEGHHLILPARHTADWFTLTELERTQADEVLRVLSTRLREADPTIAGFNVGSNAGQVAGQTVLHAHLHLIPRRNGDAADPRGGVRWVLPQHARYW